MGVSNTNLQPFHCEPVTRLSGETLDELKWCRLSQDARPSRSEAT